MAETEPEGDLLKRVMMRASQLGARIFRNNVGLGWTGKATQYHRSATISIFPGDVVIRSARPLHAGLIKGSSDAIGWLTVKIKPEHVGVTFAVFLALETKVGTKATPEQKQFLLNVYKAGGIGRVITDETQVDDLFKPYVDRYPPTV